MENEVRILKGIIDDGGIAVEMPHSGDSVSGVQPIASPTDSQNGIPTMEDSTKNNSTFDADEVLDAYFHGKNFSKQRVKNKFKNGILLTQQVCMSFHRYLLSRNIDCGGIFLNPSHPFLYEALFLVPEKEWCKDAFDECYLKSFEIMDAFDEMKQRFSLSIVFVPQTGQIDVAKLIQDGFIDCLNDDTKTLPKTA